MRALAAAAALALLAGPARAEAVPDMPDPGMPEGAEETLAVVREAGAYRLPLGPFADGDVPKEELTGRVVWRAFRLDDGEIGTGAIMQSYRERLAAQGFEIVLDCVDTACGGFDFRFALELLPAPGMLVDVADFRYITARRGAAAATVLASKALGRLYVQTVSVLESAPEPVAIVEAPALEESGGGDLHLPRDAPALRAALERDGHLQVRGLAFQVGGARLTGTSAPALDALAALLLQDAALAVVIVGHSDNQGELDVNLTLSRARAEAVRDALVARGVPEGQLQAEGVAFLAPVATNSTEEGRARNRRVELVLR